MRHEQVSTMLLELITTRNVNLAIFNLGGEAKRKTEKTEEEKEGRRRTSRESKRGGKSRGRTGRGTGRTVKTGDCG